MPDTSLCGTGTTAAVTEPTSIETVAEVITLFRSVMTRLEMFYAGHAETFNTVAREIRLVQEAEGA